MRKKFIAMFLLCSVVLAGCSSPSDSDERTETQMEQQENAETQTGQSSSVLEEPENIFDCYEEEASSSRQEIQEWAGEIAATVQ